MSSPLVSASFVVATILPALAAQGSITNTNVSYAVGTISASQADSVSAAFTANAGTLPNALFEHWWYYRIDADANESPFKNDGTLTQTYAGSHADLDWANVDNRGLISASLDIDAISTGPTSGVVVSRMTIRNLSASPIRLNMFHYVDIDTCGFAGNTASGTPGRHTVTNPSCGERVEFYAACIDRFAAGEFAGNELGLADGIAGDLSNTALPFTGDYTGAFQWKDRVLRPGERWLFTASLAHNDSGCPASFEYYGAALPGAAGIPEITSIGLPILGTSPLVAIGNMPFPTTVALFKGPNSLNAQILEWTLLVDPITSLTAFAPGAGGFPISIPVIPVLCGKDFFFQWFGLDGGTAGGSGVSHTRGLKWIIGRY